MLPCHITLPGRVRRVDETPCSYGERYVFDNDTACFRLRPRIYVCGAVTTVTVTPADKDVICAPSATSGRYCVRHVATAAVNPPSEPVIYPCRCCLDMRALMRSASDLPSPPLPLFRCEYHEILRSLPPRLQSYPWQLCFDTARDGFSLRNFYRHMEWAHKERMATIGLFFVTARETGTATQHDDTMQVVCTLCPDATCSSREVSETHRGDTRDARPSPPHHRPAVGVIGCFTTEAPCLGVHSARGFFGSVETFVFRLRGAARRRRAAIAQSRHRFPDSEILFADVTSSSSGALLQPGSASETDLPDGSYCSSSSSSSLRYASLMPCDVSSTAASVATRETRTPRARGLLCKYAWSGDHRNEQFIHCRQDFLGIGGGADGAAIAVDQNLQYGTSSGFCPTFNAPALYGRPAGGLGHAEFIVLRTAWFAVCEHDAKALRAMTAMEQAQYCSCGRTQPSALLESGLAEGTAIHHCDDGGVGLFAY